MDKLFKGKLSHLEESRIKGIRLMISWLKKKLLVKKII